MIESHQIPQADKLDTIRLVVEAIARGALDGDVIGAHAGLSGRHVNYYRNAARTLGFLTQEKRGIERVTRDGTALLETPVGGPSESLVFELAVRKSPVVRAAVGGELLVQDFSVERIKRRLESEFGLSESTALRRAQTLDSWRKKLQARSEAIVDEDQPLDSSCLSVRARGAFDRLGVRTKRQLRRVSNAQLTDLRNCGAKTTAEITGFAESLGVELVDELPAEVCEYSLDTELALLFEVGEFVISTRTRNVLRTSGLAFIGELVSETPRSLSQRDGCGAKTVLEIKELLARLGLGLSSRVVDWSQARARELRRKNRGALTELRATIAQQRFEVMSADFVAEDVEEHIRALADKNAVGLIIRSLDARNGRAPTLKEVGDDLGLTRERVRQVLEKFRRSACRSPLAPSLLIKALKLVDASSPLTRFGFLELMRTHWPDEPELDPAYYLAAARLFGIETELEVEPRGIAVTRSSQRDLVGDVHRLASKLVSRWGCTTVDEVVARFEEGFDVTLSPSLVSKVLSEVDDFCWLDEDEGWFWLRDNGKNRLINRIDKILAVSKRIDAAELRAGIARDPKMDGFAPTRRILLSLCEQLDDCNVTGTLVEDTRPRSASELLSKSELEVVRFFRENGPLLNLRELEKIGDDFGMPRATLNARVFSSPVVRRFARGVYGVAGSTVAPGCIRAMKMKTGRPRSVMGDHGWTTAGNPWIAYTLSAGAVSNGCFSIPGALGSRLNGKFLVHSSGGDEVTSLTVSGSQLWGMLRYYSRRGGEPGDQLTITFDLQDRSASIDRIEDVEALAA